MPAKKKRRKARAKSKGTDQRTASREKGSGYALNNDAVEEALITGEHRALLESYFGEEVYEELTTLATRARSTRVRGGPRVLILPGIMGSKLGLEGKLFDDTIWVDFLDIIAGRLLDLSLTSGEAEVEALGVILLAYLKLKLRLRLAGLDADFYPYDWRQSLDRLGKALADKVLRETSDSGAESEVFLVVHSMGGLVARAALAALSADASKIRRVIMLGTPNYGSFVPVAALSGTHSLVRKIAKLDVVNGRKKLVEQVFGTFPGLYQMLPWRERFSSLDLYDQATWPSRRSRPDAALLRAAPAVQGSLAGGSDRIKLIAGINQETITGLRFDDNEFIYTSSYEGDGTVPLAFAELEGVKTYFVEEQHGSLPNNRDVSRAVVDIVETGETDVLPDTWTPTRRGVIREYADRDLLDAEVFGGRTGESISQSEFRQLLVDFAAAPRPTKEAVSVSASEPPQIGVTKQPIVIGRRSQGLVDIHLAHGDVTQVDSRAIVLGMFRGVDPSGAASAIDARLQGIISEFTERRMFNGEVGEIFILPTGRHAIKAEMVVFAGMGSYSEFDEGVVRLVAENVARTLSRTKVEDFATIMIGAGSGISMSDALRCMIDGFFSGLRDTTNYRRITSITLCEYDTARFAEMRETILGLATTPLFDDVEVTVDEIALEQAPPAPAPIVRTARVGPDPIFLFVRELPSRERRVRREGDVITLQTSLLTAGAKATVISDTIDIEPLKLDRQLERIEMRSFNFEALPSFGEALARLVLPQLTAAVLETVRDRHIVVINDAMASRIPWETICLGGRFPAHEQGMSRKYEAANLSVAKWLEQRRLDDILNLLLIVNPTEDLDGADAEGDRLRKLLAGNARVRLTELRHSDATWSAVRAAFRSGKYDIVHYAGHAFFDPENRARSGIVCSGNKVLSGLDLVHMQSLPALTFFNACEAGRVRAASKRQQGRASRDRIEANHGLAEAFLRGGVGNYIGTYWPVGDEPAKKFADAFYDKIMQGKTVGQALQSGRRRVHELESVDWADYVHYGSPNFLVKLNGARGHAVEN